MKNIINNKYSSERSVEIPFLERCLNENPETNILDVGGMPTDEECYEEITEAIENNHIVLEIADLRGGNYVGNFVDMKFDKEFDSVIFLSSLEHFPQCTEGDMVYRENEDKKGFQKAIEVLKPGGKIFLTVPFGKAIWQPYHQNYDMERIRFISNGIEMIKSYTYKYIRDDWILCEPDTFGDIYYTNRAYGVGCFVFQKLGE